MIFFTSDLHFSHGNICKFSGRPWLPEEGLRLKEAALQAASELALLENKFGPEKDEATIKELQQSLDAWKKYKVPFDCVNAMDEKLIENWNSVVGENDTVYFLGDFTFGKNVKKLTDRLNGKIYAIRGNHDKPVDNEKSEFGWVKDYFELKVPDPSVPRGSQKIILFHYAIRVWNQMHYNTWHLYGHSHGTLPEEENKSFDVGIDAIAHRFASSRGEKKTREQDYRPISYEEVSSIMAAKEFKPLDHHKGS